MDALLKTSSVDLKSPEEGEKKSSDYKNDSDVMKELDDPINSWRLIISHLFVS